MKTVIRQTLVKFQRYYDKGLIYVVFGIPVSLAVLDYLLPTTGRGLSLIFPILSGSFLLNYLNERKLYYMSGSISMAFMSVALFWVVNFSPPSYMIIIIILIIVCLVYATLQVRPEPKGMNPSDRAGS